MVGIFSSWWTMSHLGAWLWCTAGITRQNFSHGGTRHNAQPLGHITVQCSREARNFECHFCYICLLNHPSHIYGYHWWLCLTIGWVNFKSQILCDRTLVVLELPMGSPWTHWSACFWFQSTGIKGMHNYVWLNFADFNKSLPTPSCLQTLLHFVMLP